MLITGDVVELSKEVNVVASNKIIAAVPRNQMDFPADKRADMIKHGFDVQDLPHFNSGVVFYSFTKWREVKMGEEL